MVLESTTKKGGKITQKSEKPTKTEKFSYKSMNENHDSLLFLFLYIPPKLAVLYDLLFSDVLLCGLLSFIEQLALSNDSVGALSWSCLARPG